MKLKIGRPAKFTFELNMVERDKNGFPISRKSVATCSPTKIFAIFCKHGGNLNNTKMNPPNVKV